jgi:tetratricopeptide (TPR) repeat protein
MRALLVLIMALALCASPSETRAQGAASKAAAEQLFLEGRALMQKGKYEEALAKFHASLDLDPGSGTQGNLALCYERMGKLASAWGHYREAAVRAERERNAKRTRIARERAAALEPRLPRLLIRLSSPDTPAGLVVTRDGVPLPATVLGTAVYVDPGEHEVTAAIPGHERFSMRVTLSESEYRAIDIPALAPAPEPQAPPATQQPGPAETRATAPAPAVRPREPRDPGRPRRIAGLTVGGAGLVAVAVSLGAGATAITTWDEAFESGACNADTLVCTPEGQEQTDTARSRARLSNVLLGAGVAAVAAGAVLYFTAPRAPEKRSARIVPFTNGDGLGLAVMGGF